MFCDKAKKLLNTKQIPFNYYDIKSPQHKDRLTYLKDQGFNTVPQILQGDTHIGGYTELVAHLKDRLNQHFKRSEFACQCGCGFDTVDTELLDILTFVREYFDSPTRITSGCRCPDHNRKVGGALKSFHQYGVAADIQVSGISPREVYEALCENFPGVYGIMEYSGWVHVDARSYEYRRPL